MNAVNGGHHGIQGLISMYMVVNGMKTKLSGMLMEGLWHHAITITGIKLWK